MSTFSFTDGDNHYTVSDADLSGAVGVHIVIDRQYKVIVRAGHHGDQPVIEMHLIDEKYRRPQRAAWLDRIVPR